MSESNRLPETYYACFEGFHQAAPIVGKSSTVYLGPFQVKLFKQGRARWKAQLLGTGWIFPEAWSGPYVAQAAIAQEFATQLVPWCETAAEAGPPAVDRG